MSDWKDMVCEKARELAESRYDKDFYELSQEVRFGLMDDAVELLMAVED